MSSEDLLKNHILAEYRSIRAFSIAANIPYSTIDNILKRGLGKAGVSTVIEICSFLEIDTEELYYGKIMKKPRNISDIQLLTLAEQTHIKKYRTLDERGKQNIDTLLDIEYSRAIPAKAKDETSAAVQLLLNDQELTREQTIQLINEQFDAQEKGQMSKVSTIANGRKEKLA